MKVVKIFCLLAWVFSGVLCSCTQQKEDTSNRSYFTFDREDRKVVVPVLLNDSVAVRLVFDSGAGPAYERESVTLDSGILSANPSLPQNHVLATGLSGVAWSTIVDSAILYDSMQLKLQIGRTEVVYSKLHSMPWKKQMNSDVSDGLFDIPQERHDARLGVEL